MNIFLYGTLLDEVLRERLLGRRVDGVPAHLYDHVVLNQQDKVIPVLVRRKGAVVSGLLLRGLTAQDAARLDAYELPFDYHVQQMEVDVEGACVAAQIYMPGPSVASSDVAFDLGAWQATSGALSREMAVEIGSYVPPLSGDTLKQQWHMIALRAGVRLRARQDKTPTTRRYTPDAGDVEIVSRQPLDGDFFKLAAFEMAHRTFQKETVGPLKREVLVACDAAIILPYDPKTDCVLLVEQLRTGPLMRGVANPWVLEPVAGMIDGHETPQDAARRETQEEAGLTDVALEEMFSFYASPGASTDYFFCYLAVADLPSPTTFTGGLAEENEDLRLHVLPFDDAFALIETGEANVGPLIAMLYWLDRQRERLRSAA